MNLHRVSTAPRAIPLVIAIAQCFCAGTVFAGSEHHALTQSPRADNTDSLKNSGQLSKPQRFVVRADAPVQSSRVIANALPAALQRAGLSAGPSGTVRGSAAVRAVVQRNLSVPGWHVVAASRPLDAIETANFIAQLAAQPGIKSVEIDPFIRRADVPTFERPNDPDYGTLQWNFTDARGGVRAEEAWKIGNGSGVVVAVLDTGIVKDTPDLAANVIPGYDMITDKRISRRASDGRAPGGWDLGDWIEENYCTGWAVDGNHPADRSSWHGTHVAGTVAQETNNGKAVAGLAYGAKVMPVRVLGSCGGFGSDIADGMVWAAGGDVAGLPKNENPAEVLNLSLGSGGPMACPSFYQEAIDKVNKLGSVIVVAAGNSSGEAGNYTMSSCKGVISVGATGINGSRASYSNYGTRVDLSAPGGGGGSQRNGYIWQVVNGSETSPSAEFGLGGLIGTSMASPHVAAVAAIVQSVAPKPLTTEQMRGLLTSTARPFPSRELRPIGSGILDARAAAERGLNFGKPIEATVVQSGVTTKVPDLAPGASVLFAIKAAPGARELHLLSYGGRGKTAIYVGYEDEPSSARNVGSSVRPGTNQTLTIAAPAAGTYYVKVVGVDPTNGALLRLTLR